MENYYKIKISPENIVGNLIKVEYPSGTTHDSGYTYVYSSMTEILKADQGNSILTGLTIPVLLTQYAHDLGYYNLFDGNISEYSFITNFLFSSSTQDPYTYFITNTSNQEIKNYLGLSQYTIDWGDGITPIEEIEDIYPNGIFHTYLSDGEYVIRLKQDTPWGVNVVEKTINVPYQIADIPNPKGTAYFVPKSGGWSATPIMYDYIFTGDSISDVNSHTSEKYTTIPTLIEGVTQSRLSDLETYGSEKYKLFVDIILPDGSIGRVETITSIFTGYSIDGIYYVDWSDGITTFSLNTSGFTSNNIQGGILVKNEALLNVVMDTEVQSEVFIERGKNSANERVERLGEVSSIGQLTKYGYGFFNFK